MANTIAEATGIDRNRRKDTHRLGSERAHVRAATWRTFVDALVHKDGSGYVTITRDGKVIHTFRFEEE